MKKSKIKEKLEPYPPKTIHISKIATTSMLQHQEGFYNSTEQRIYEINYTDMTL
jgi:hypothetical protein